MTRRTHATAEEIQRAVNLCQRHTQSEAARIMGVPRQTLIGWVKRASTEGITPDTVAVEEDHQREVIGLQDQIRALKAEIKGIHRDNLSAQIVRREILGLASMTPEPPAWTLGGTAGDRTTVPVCMWSDWHWGEVVDPAQVNDINAYSLEIARERVRRLVSKTIKLCERWGDDYPGAVIALIGDMISGDIHDELSETNELPTMPVLLDLFGVLIEAIRQMADYFGRLLIVGVAGNHGRNTVKPRFKNRSYSNFDWLLYCLLEKHFESDARVRFYTPAGTDAPFTVMGHRFLATHGDNLGTAGGDGIIGAIGPIVRGAKKTGDQFGHFDQPFDTMLIGHWHQWIPLSRVVVNGSLKGFDEYAMLKLRAAPEPPKQGLLLVNREYGLFEAVPVYADEPRQRAEAEWVSWPKAAA